MADDDPRPMSQEEIDALFAQVGGTGSIDADPVPAPEAEPGSAGPDAATPDAAGQDSGPESEEPMVPAAGATLGDGPLSQSSIDELLSQMNAGEPAAAPAQTEPPAAQGASGSAGADPGPMSQSSIDDLLAEMGAGDGDAPEPEATASPAATAGSGGKETAAAAADGPLDQNAIDDLVGQMLGVSDGAQSQPEPEPAAADPERTLDQSEIDAMLAAGGGGGGDGGTGVASSQAGTRDLTASEADMTGAREEESDALEGGTGLAGAAISQGDIDKMLAELAGGGADDSEPEEPGSAVGVGPQTNTITADALQELVQKHATADEDGGGIGSSSVINQDDIQALVEQMTQATGEVPGREQIGAILSEREEDIDAILDNAANDQTISDAVQPSMVGSGPPQYGGPGIDPAQVLSPEELRGTRYILVAGVILLAMCAVTLVLVVSAINRLTVELESGRESQLEPTSDFATDFRDGEIYLQSADPDEVDKGIRFFRRLKQRYRNNLDHRDQIDWRLARHYRAHGAHSKAVDEYRAIRSRSSGLIDDPRFYVEFADSLMAVDRNEQALETIYDLIANESYYLSGGGEETQVRDPAVVARNQRAVKEAFLLLGQIYMGRADPGLAAHATEVTL
ncbi:MAG: hypothetical protein ACOCYP_09485 [Planctomycetota bacterium]